MNIECILNGIFIKYWYGNILDNILKIILRRHIKFMLIYQIYVPDHKTVITLYKSYKNKLLRTVLNQQNIE
jgi:hypothetical protein